MDGADTLESIIILDDFLIKPDEMRDHALGADYPPSDDDAYFPGRNSAGRYELPWLTQHVSNLVGEPLMPGTHTSHGSFRLCLAGETGRGGVHVDKCHWSGILYLSLPEHCQGGTDYFRHRATNSARAPVLPEEYEALGVTKEQIEEDTVWPHCNDPAKWEPVRHVPMRFNRFIVFRPWLWHNAGIGFGDSIENGRLIYVVFYIRTDAV